MQAHGALVDVLRWVHVSHLFRRVARGQPAAERKFPVWTRGARASRDQWAGGRLRGNWLAPRSPPGSPMDGQAEATVRDPAVRLPVTPLSVRP